MAETNICSVEGCGRKHRAKGFCNKHYYQVKLHGKVLTRTVRTKNNIVVGDEYATIDLYNSKNEKIAETIIDLDDVERCSAHKWYLGQRGYATSKINGKLVYLHHLLVGNKRTDHINREPLDNRKINLRECTQRQNCYNQKSKGGSSDYKGVYWSTHSRKWEVQCGRKYFGAYTNEHEAAVAYNNAAIKMYGEFAYINEITCSATDML